MSQFIRVIAAVISREDRFLICQRPQHKRYGGLWEFPGGKCEPGESNTAAAQRELDEELSVQVVKVGDEEIAFPDPDSTFLIVFVPVQIKGEPACNEHAAFRWAKLDELQHLPLAPSDRRYVEFRLAKK
jgi:8-oxo-dGTP diphosphatase